MQISNFTDIDIKTQFHKYDQIILDMAKQIETLYRRCNETNIILKELDSKIRNNIFPTLHEMELVINGF